MINFSELLWKPGRTRDRGLRTAPSQVSEEIEAVSGLEHVSVEEATLSAGNRVALLTEPRSVSADVFRFIRMRLRELRELAKLRTLMITSPLPEDGKSTIAMCLATALAEGGKRPTLLIEADLHRPGIAKNLGLRSRPGLAECVEDGLGPMDQIVKVEPLGWYLLQAGKTRTNPTDLLQSEALQTAMQQVSPYFDWILIDTPPVLPLTDALTLSRQADAALLVARADRTSREAIEKAVTLIGKKHVLGIVLNGAEGLSQLYSQYYGAYGKS